MTLTTSPQTTELACGTRDAAAACVDVLREVVAGLDPDTLLATEAPHVWGLFDQGEKLCSAAKILAARKVDESRIWEREGMRSAAEYLALQGGTTRDVARDALKTSERLRDLPNVEDALRRGELSAAQVHPIADAAAHDPAAQAHLVDHAKVASLKELKDECLRRKAAADPKPQDTRDRIHKDRYFRLLTDAEGAWKLSGRGPLDHAGSFGAALNPLIDDQFKKARAEGERGERDKLAYDALQEMARLAHATYYGYDPSLTDEAADVHDSTTSAPSPSGTSHSSDSDRGTSPADHPHPSDPDGGDSTGTDTSPDAPPEPTYAVDRLSGAQLQMPGTDIGNIDGDTQVALDRAPRRAQQPQTPRKTNGKAVRQPNPRHLGLLRLDLTALRRGRTEPGEICHLAGSGPITVPAARALLGRSTIKLVLSTHGQVVNVTHIGTGTRAAERLSLGPPALFQSQRTQGQPTPTHLALIHLDTQTMRSHDGPRTEPGHSRPSHARRTTPAVPGPTLHDDQTPALTFPGGGSVTATAARDLLGFSVLQLVLARGVAVAGFVQTGRKATVAQRTALLWAQPECSVLGCPHTFVEIDHRADWAKTHLHSPRSPRQALQPPPPAKDLPGLGARGRHRQTLHGPTRRPSPPIGLSVQISF